MIDGPGYGDLSYAPPAPADPTAGDPTAVMGRRILAWLIDLALFLAVVIGVFAALAERVDVPEAFSLDPCEQLQDQAPERASTCIDLDDEVFITSEGDAGVQTLTSLGYLAFFVLIQGMTGASPGKLVTGIRVVDDQGRTAGIGRSALRTVLWAVDGAPWFIPLVGFITGLTSTGRRRVGDLAAGTWVVSKEAVGTPPALSTPSFDPTATAGWTPPSTPSAPLWSLPATTSPPVLDAGDLTPDPDHVRAIVSEVEPTRSEPEAATRDLPAERDPAEPTDLGPPDLTPPPDVAADPSWTWEPPTTPGDDFGTVAADTSPTAGPTPLVAPGSEAPPTSAPTDAPAELPPPQWDQARGTYIQWEPRQQAWLQWDTVGQRWKAIDT